MITDANERERLLAALLERRLPDENGRFGPFGGRYVPETLMPAVARLEHGRTAASCRRRIFRKSSGRNCAPGSAGRPRSHSRRP